MKRSGANADLHSTLNNDCRKMGVREIRLRYLLRPSLNHSIAEALIDRHRVIEKICADIPAGDLTLQDMQSFNDRPIARGVGDTAIDAIKTMWPLQWRAPRNGEGKPVSHKALRIDPSPRDTAASSPATPTLG